MIYKVTARTPKGTLSVEVEGESRYKCIDLATHYFRKVFGEDLADNDIWWKEVEDKDAEIERLNKEVDRLSQVVLYNDGVIVDIIKEFSQRARDQLRTGNIIMDKSIHDIIDRIENEMLEELK